ncbi:response regulator [Tamlana crocina]|uniref:histidine kinase n=1 Tax=Tamlana crocina TaxID=393006 RepID=A0ABX1DE27_9FLAO|nr:response regulator [Tamlana crocina]NJX16601.1 response regulator [Tamlana crocina]
MLSKLKKKVVLFPIASFTITVLIVILVWNKALINSNRLIEENVIQTGKLVFKEFTNIVKADFAQIHNLKTRIEFTDGMYLNHWEQDASMLLKQNPSFRFLEWIDSTMVIRKIMPLKGNEGALNLDISKIEYRRDEWLRHRYTDSPNITPWSKLTQSGEAFLIDFPITFQNTFQGTITGGVDFSEKFNKLATSLEDQYAIELWDHKSNLFYALNTENKLLTEKKLVYQDSILIDPLDNQSWHLKVTPSNKLYLSENRLITNIALGVGVLFCILTSLLINFYLRAREGTKLALRSNAMLLNTNEKLNNERNRAEKASKAKSEFLANMSHEIRTPLHAVLGFIELLKDSKLNKTDKEYLDLMEKSSNNLLNIINDILDIEKIESGKTELVETNFNPLEKIKELIEVNQFIFVKKNLYLKSNFKNVRGLNVIGDESKFIQVINNIVKNGLKFTNTGGVTVNYSEDLVGENELRVHVTIKDTGIGIPKDRLKTIFDRFTQVENGVKKQYEGSGLGLAICKVLINMMGGKIKVKSTPNKGTKFKFNMLFKLADKQHVEKQIPVNQKVDYSNLSVLIVDDNNLNIIVLKKFLEDLGITPDAAKNGQLALEKFQEKPYHLIFMDIHMPVMDGWEATREIRKQDEDVIIFGLSANVTTEAIDQALESGMNNYLSKPFKKEHLYKLLHFHFSND